MTHEQKLETNGAARQPDGDNWRDGLKIAILYASHIAAFLVGVEFACYLLAHGGGR